MFFAMTILALSSSVKAEVARDTKEIGVETKRVANEIWYIHNIQIDQKTCDSINNCTIRRSFEYPVESFTLSDSNWYLNNIQMGNLYENGAIEYKEVYDTRKFLNFGFVAKNTEVKLNLFMDKENKKIYGKHISNVKNVFAAENLIFLLSILFFSGCSMLSFRKWYADEAFSDLPVAVSFILGLLTIIFLLAATCDVTPFYTYRTITWLLLVACAAFYLFMISRNNGSYPLERSIRIIFYPIMAICYIVMYNIYTELDLWQVSVIAVGLGFIFQWLIYRPEKNVTPTAV